MAKLEGLLGLCRRAGQITLGAEMTLREIRAGRAGLVLADAGASPGTLKKLGDACAYRGVQMRILPQGALARACGQEERVAAAVKNGALCQKIKETLSPSDEDGKQTEGNFQRYFNAKCGGASVE